MNDRNPQLLPSGLYDLLPPDARKETDAINRLLGTFGAFGYEQVTPPLMEFEASLLSGRGAALAAQTFRVMDPLSHEMLAVRADMTLQVARIATSRLAHAPRPLRLCYAGPILQTKPEALQNERQLTQAGIELIGSASPQADVEVMIIATEALAALGVSNLTIDLNLPGLLLTLCPEAEGDPALQQQIRDTVSHRDSVGITRLPLANASMIADIVDAGGLPAKALATLEKHGLPQAAGIRSVMEQLQGSAINAAITFDPLEYRGFEYHKGISFSLFAKGLRHELGRGGRYEVEGETATGFTIYVSRLLDALPVPLPAKRILLPLGISQETARRLRAEGWTTVHALTADSAAEARTLGISEIYSG